MKTKTEPSDMGLAARRLATAVIVVNFGSHELIERNLPLFPADEVQVLVVDNFTSSTELDAVALLCSRRGWRLLALDHNIGFGAAVNAGVRTLWGEDVDTFLFVNPDCALTPEVARRLAAESRNEPNALVSPALTTSTGYRSFDGAVVSMRTGEIRGTGSRRPWRCWPLTRRPVTRPADEQEWLPGTCLAVGRELLARIGGFDEAYFLYWEDIDLSLRCVRNGGRLIVRRDLVVVHESGGTQGVQPGRAKSALYYRYNCRNRLLFAARHVGGVALVSWLVFTAPVSWQILLRGGRRQLLRSWRAWAATARGCAEGMGLLASGVIGHRSRVRSKVARFDTAPAGSQSAAEVTS